MNTAIFLIAWRSLSARTHEKNISTMIFICFLGIFIGSFSLALVTAITHGFEIAIHEKMQGIHAQIIIRAYGKQINTDKLYPVLKNEFPEISAISSNTTRHAIIDNQQDITSPTVVLLKAIHPLNEANVSTLHKKISLPLSTSLEKTIHDNTILIGKELAQELERTVGDTFELFFTSSEQKTTRKKITLDKAEVVIGGIFDSGIDEFDSSVIFCSFDFLEQLFANTGVEQLQIKLNQGVNEKKTIEKLRKKLNLEVYSWKDLYKPLVAALTLEKYVSFFILALITLVASMNIISLLFMLITQKNPEIAILKAMGMKDSAITSIFLFIGMFIAGTASLCGLIAAYITSLILEQYPFIKLPDVYYVSHLPVKMNFTILITVFLLVIFVSFFATWIPTRKTKYINIAQILRFEG